MLASVFFAVAHFTGLASEEATYVRAAAGSIDIKGLFLGGAVLGALGAIDDMTITQAASVYELQAANPDLHHLRLYRSAMRIGRDHVGSTVNTLLLAYAGASMPLLLLFVLSGQSSPVNRVAEMNSGRRRGTSPACHGERAEQRDRGRHRDTVGQVQREERHHDHGHQCDGRGIRAPQKRRENEHE